MRGTAVRLELDRDQIQERNSHRNLTVPLIVVLESSMPCQEFLELEASLHRYSERRQQTGEASKERRSGKPTGFRMGEARLAFMLMLHRQSCAICRG